ncbi:MAG: hypothetical protein IPH35_19365 [Rhodoferax sp.]|nr:hypothetical protein [Rhodoferax sp.]
MLHSYTAQLHGNQLVWLDAAPPLLAEPRPVVVVLEEPTTDALPLSVASVLLRARGALGHASREAVLAELAQSRQDWEKNDRESKPIIGS